MRVIIVIAVDSEFDVRAFRRPPVTGTTSE